MPKVNKTLHGDVTLLAKKIAHGIACYGTWIAKQDEWSSEAYGQRVIVQVYEKLSETPDVPHLSMTVVYYDTGEEIRLHATTAGGNQKFFLNPYPAGEGELTGVLNIVLAALDDIIM